MHVALRSLIAPVVIASFCPAALAQLIEDVELRRDGANAVVNVRFVTGIQFQRVTTARAGDLAQVYYTVLPTRAALNFQGSQRRVPNVGAIPEITVTDETVSRTNLNRKLIVRLGKKTAFRVRAGKGNRSIEIVLTGLGDSVRLSTTQSPSAALAPGQSYIVTLQSSADPGHFLQSSVPARLQQYQTFTSRRTVDGRTLHDINIGYFGTLREANSALALLKPRFPQATVVALQAPAGTEVGPGNTPAEVEAKAAELMAAAVKGNEDGNFAATLEATLLQATRNAPKAFLDTAAELSTASMAAYRALVYDTPRFAEYFFAATPIREIAELNIGSRPASRKATQKIEDLRAIPWGFSWGQCRLTLPGWYGFGSAVHTFLHKEGPKGVAKQKAQLQKMVKQWPFFSTLLSNMDMVMAKSDLALATRYAELVEDKRLRTKVFTAIEAEWHRTADALALITGEKQRLVNNAALQRSMRHRFPYIDPLHHLQVELVRRYRAGENHADRDEKVRRGIHISINGIAAGLRNTG